MTLDSETNREIWLVTGAGGFLGLNAGLFLQEKVKTIGLSRTPLIGFPFDVGVNLDLRDSLTVARLVHELKPTVILHAAAISGHETCANDPDQAYKVNVEATKVLSESASEINARFIHISTDAVFSGDTGNYRESDPVNPFSLYGETKLAGEFAVEESGSSAMILRTNFFGWSSTNKRSVLEFFINALREGRTVNGYPDFIVTSLYVQTLVETIFKLEAAKFSGLLNLASSDPLSKFDFGVTVANVFNLDAHLIQPVSAQKAINSTSRSRNLSLNTELASTVIGHDMESQFDGIKRAELEESSLAKTLRSIK